MSLSGITSAPLVDPTSFPLIPKGGDHRISSNSARGLGMRVRKVICLTIVLAFCALLPLMGQETRGTLLGRVSDPTSAVIVGANVEAFNTHTGVRLTSTTNGSGDYIIPFLIPGPYTITVESAGFKKYTRPGILVRVNDRITIDATMELGQASQNIEVSAESPLLETSTASMGQVVNSRSILELPSKDGMVLIMATLSPGVSFTPTTSGYVRPYDTDSPSYMTIDGTRVGSTQFMVDGAANMQQNRVAYSPPPGVVEELKVQTATFDASYGFMAGGAINMSLKSGTNAVHGQAYYFIQNPALNADQFFRLAVGKPPYREHRWGGSSSGPVYLPKLYDGHNRTFWMYGYEGIFSFDPTPFTVAGVPTPAQRAGDFSALLALGSRYQIYDPYSIAPAPNGRFSRQPLSGNRIPDNLINPTSKKIAALWDPPNQAGTIDGTNNYTKGQNNFDHYWNHIVRIDHNLSAKQRFYVRTNFTSLTRPEFQRHNGARGDFYCRYNRGFSFDHVYVPSTRFFINTRYTLTRFIFADTPYQLGWDLAGLGFSSNFMNQINQLGSGSLRLPQITAGGYDRLSSQTYRQRHDNIHELASNITSVIGSHTLRYGVAYRVYQENNFDLGSSSGSFTFDSTWTGGPLDNSPAAPNGQGMASFLYGLPGSGSLAINDSYAEQTRYWAFYSQDDWRLNKKLTLSLGLRYELPSPLTERYNRSVRGFNTAGVPSIAAQVLQNYAANPVPQIPVSQFSVHGGLTFAGAGGLPRTLWNTALHEFMPRIGLAYSITPKTVLRAGYGIFFDPLGVVNLHVDQTGFSSSTTYVASVDNGLHFTAPFANPFPDGFLRPYGASLGVSTYLGQPISFFDQNLRNPYMQRWQFALQREWPGSTVIELSYVGNRGTRLRATQDLNPIPPSYLSTLPVRDQTTINLLNSQVPNPFYPLLPRTNLASTTVALSQLLKPYPQFTGVTPSVNSGYSWYHSMQVRLEKRFSSGLSASLSYTWSKMMEAISYLNPTDRRPEEVISDQDRTHRMVVTMLYELPFGPRKHWAGSASAPVSKIISGWQVQGIYTAQSGAPLGFGNAILLCSLDQVPLSGSQRSVSRWFNTACFNTNSGQQLGSNIVTLSTRFSGIRGDTANNWDISAIKNTQLKETVRLQFRAEAINALNHPQFTAPNTTPTSTAFGQVTGQWSWPRVIQFGLKILF
jgi:hypothetical protein